MSCKETLQFIDFLFKATKNGVITWKSKLSYNKIEYYIFLPKSDMKVIMYTENYNPEIYVISENNVLKIPLDFSLFPEQNKIIEDIVIKLMVLIWKQTSNGIDKQLQDYLKSI